MGRRGGEALKSARVEPAEGEAEREIAIMESTTKLVLELCPEVPSGTETLNRELS